MNETIKPPAPFDPVPVGSPAAVLEPSRPVLPPTRPTPRQTVPMPSMPAPAPSMHMPASVEVAAPPKPEANPLAGSPPPNPSVLSGLLWDLLRPNRAKLAVLAGIGSLAAGAFGLNLLVPSLSTPTTNPPAKIKIAPEETKPVAAAPKPTGNDAWNPISDGKHPEHQVAGLPAVNPGPGQQQDTARRNPGELTIPSGIDLPPIGPIHDQNLQRTAGTQLPTPGGPAPLPIPGGSSGPAPLPTPGGTGGTSLSPLPSVPGQLDMGTGTLPLPGGSELKPPAIGELPGLPKPEQQPKGTQTGTGSLPLPGGSGGTDVKLPPIGELPGLPRVELQPMGGTGSLPLPGGTGSGLPKVELQPMGGTGTLPLPGGSGGAGTLPLPGGSGGGSGTGAGTLPLPGGSGSGTDTNRGRGPGVGSETKPPAGIGALPPIGGSETSLPPITSNPGNLPVTPPLGEGAGHPGTLPLHNTGNTRPGTGGTSPGPLEPVIGAGATNPTTPGTPVSNPGPALQPPLTEAKTDYDVDLHRPRAGDTYAIISKAYYGGTQYATALQAFNRNLPIERVGEVQVPPVHVIRKFAPVTPVTGTGAAKTPDRFDSTRATPGLEDGPDWGAPGVVQNGQTVYTLFTVPRKGLTLRDVAKTYYGNERSYTKLLNPRNPKFDPDEELPVGTQLQVPTESVPFR